MMSVRTFGIILAVTGLALGGSALAQVQQQS